MARQRFLHIGRIWRQNDDFNQKITEKLIKDRVKKTSSRSSAEAGLSDPNAMGEDTPITQHPETLAESISGPLKETGKGDHQPAPDIEEAFEKVLYQRQKQNQNVAQPKENSNSDTSNKKDSLISHASLIAEFIQYPWKEEPSVIKLRMDDASQLDQLGCSSNNMDLVKHRFLYYKRVPRKKKDLQRVYLYIGVDDAMETRAQSFSSDHAPATPVPSSSEDFYVHVNPKLQNKPQPNVQLSNCHGRKRALLIGINYFGSSNELKGCINDVHNVKDFLVTLYNFKEDDMVILTDDKQDPKFLPTRANIISAMQWLVHDSKPNDSGHGGSVKDVSGDEDDGFDETIYPLDFEQYEGESGQIIDDALHDLLVEPLCAGSRLTAIFDSCHSGTVLDLPYVYSTKGVIKGQNLFKDAGMGLLSAGMAYASGDKNRALTSLISLGQQLMNTRDVEEQNREENSSKADVIMFSGCKDDQTSADANEAGRATGAMSHALIGILRQNPHPSYQVLLNNLREVLRDKYSQRPQMSSSHPIDVSLEFVC
ncbi:Ca(2+)-dependent cysteine protease [Apophysomyces sp. BC1015]|nr:Ca(2+)-dependent cysteine protease [Apophysomyces sp. BC1015]